MRPLRTKANVLADEYILENPYKNKDQEKNKIFLPYPKPTQVRK